MLSYTPYFLPWDILNDLFTLSLEWGVLGWYIVVISIDDLYAYCLVMCSIYSIAICVSLVDER